MMMMFRPTSRCIHKGITIQRRSISFSNLTIEQSNKTTLPKPAPQDLIFGRTFTDHMLICEYDKDRWKDPKIVPYQNLSLSPAASGLHYGLQCFEGMKAYKTIANPNDIRLFRPDKNMKRLSDSMERLQMPGYDFDANELIQCMKELIKLDKDWIPTGEGYSLYIRPTVVATHPFLGLTPPSSLILYVILCPVGPYYTKSYFKPVKLTTDTPYVRAWPGGTGNHKVGGNYAGTIKALAQAKGFDQVLWLASDRDEITEVGSMNIFFVLEHDEKTMELVTPPLDRGDILPGVTRDSILEVAKTWEDVIVSERSITMTELKSANLLEAFGAGTAAVVVPICSIQHNGKNMEIPATGPLTKRVWDAVTGIQYGRIEGPEGWSVKI